MYLRDIFNFYRLIRASNAKRERTFLKAASKSNSRINTLASLMNVVPQRVWRFVTEGRDAGALMEPPACVRGMKALDRDAFSTTVDIPSLKVPLKNIGKLGNVLRNSRLKVPRLKPVAKLADDDPDRDSYRLLLLDPRKYRTVGDFDDYERDLLHGSDVRLDSFTRCEVELRYENWNAADILKAVLPEDGESISAFAIIGHIAHLNLKVRVLEYKTLIGQVILDKNSTVKTVVNKLNTIDSTFRNFQMELLAGEMNYITTTKENGCTYQFDFSKVYWNPRLGTEHQRIVSLLSPGDVVYDIFAGVGPFAILAAKKKCLVLANDLNPESYKWLNHNRTLNKITSGFETYNLDGREFIRTEVKKHLTKIWLNEQTNGDKVQSHVIMNLPAIALEFLDAFLNLFSEETNFSRREFELPKIYCYCFVKSENPEYELQQRVRNILVGELPEEHSIRFVRNVAPNKEMFCISFKIPEQVLFGSCVCNIAESGQPESKRRKVEES